MSGLLVRLFVLVSEPSCDTLILSRNRSTSLAFSMGVRFNHWTRTSSHAMRYFTAANYILLNIRGTKFNRDMQLFSI